MNELATIPHVSFSEMEQMANAIATSNLFGMKTQAQALSLMSIAQAEGRHPALAARDYDIINGRAAKKAEAMHRDFLTGGGKIQWHKLTDSEADATFSHPIGGEVRITWDMARAAQAGFSGKENYKKFPRQMLRSRTVSEGVRTVWPVATSGMYVPEEVMDMPPVEPFKGPTIDAEEPPLKAAAARVAPAPKVVDTAVYEPPRRKVGDLLDAMELALGDAQSPGEADAILRGETMQKLEQHAQGAARTRLDAIKAKAAARFPAAQPMTPEDEDWPGGDLELVGDGKLAAG
jgi:hypothetical protein